jgi:hypothetical protein
MYDNLMVIIRPLIQEEYATGGRRVLQEGIIADFHAEPLRPHERELALAKFSFKGLFQEQDEATMVQPDYRLALYDTDRAQVDKGWSDETREEVEQTLSVIAERYEYVLAAPRSSVPPPWPRYDTYRGTAQKLVQKLVAEGHELEPVLTYERENQNREAVIQALEEELSAPDTERELVLEEEVLG